MAEPTQNRAQRRAEKQNRKPETNPFDPSERERSTGQDVHRRKSSTRPWLTSGLARGTRT